MGGGGQLDFDQVCRIIVTEGDVVGDGFVSTDAGTLLHVVHRDQ